MIYFRNLGISLRLMAALVPVSLAAGACASGHDGAREEAASGTLDMPLVTSANGHTYRLTGYIYYYGTQIRAGVPG